jgi:kynurenine 3-monooxygenase
MDFQQEYIPDEYLELKIPPGRDKHNNPTFLLDPNHLHIWPRRSFMLIAMPNKVSRRLPHHVRLLSTTCARPDTG